MSDHTLPPPAAQLRSGTAARLAGLPVTTLRVWERRYAVVAAPKTLTGQRLYSAHDVQRLRLLRQLTDRGHAIGTMAALPLAALQALASAAPPDAPDLTAGEGRLVVVGPGLARKLKAGGVASVPVVHEDLGKALAQSAGGATTADVLVVHQPSLQPVAAEHVLALAAALGARSVIVLYAFCAGPVADMLRAAGATLRREPVTANELARLVGAAPSATRASAIATVGPCEPRRFSDDELVELAEMSSPVACECPRHLAEIVMQLAGFERYSADCTSRSPADAALHRHLSSLAGAARTLFEQALERVVAEEGLVLTAR